MLERLLSEIRSGGALEVGVLAKKLDASPQLVEAMLEHLQRSGYIRPYETCDQACSGCSLKAQCSKPQRNTPLKLWQG
jgi:ribosomal protein S8